MSAYSTVSVSVPPPRVLFCYHYTRRRYHILSLSAGEKKDSGTASVLFLRVVAGNFHGGRKTKQKIPPAGKSAFTLDTDLYCVYNYF